MDYLEYELDLYTLKESQRKKEDEAVIGVIRKGHEAEIEGELLDDEGGKKNGDKFKEMRETRTGFGANVKKDHSPGQHMAEGGLEPDDDDDEEVGEDDDDDDDQDDGQEIDEDEDEGSDHNF